MKRVVAPGERFGRLVVIEESLAGTNGHRRMECLCDCGRRKAIALYSLTAGLTKSCGCYVVEQTRLMGKANATHRGTKSTAYRVWGGMKARCLNAKHAFYSSYGGRGITICSRWINSFETFYADMGPRPNGTTLDRIDNDGPYSPENCRWSATEEQQNNKRTKRMLKFGEEILTIAQWSRRVGISRGAIRNRIERGWTIEKALNAN